MCWKTYDEKNTGERIAERDIPVFKVAFAAGVSEEGAEACEPYFMPYFMRFKAKAEFFEQGSSAGTMRYECGKTYVSSGFAFPVPPRGAVPDDFLREYGISLAPPAYEVDEGFHSYSPECRTETDRGDACFWLKVYFYDRCLCSLSERPGESLVIMSCSIPEGSRYRLNERGEYVSDRIRVDGFSPAIRKKEGPRARGVNGNRKN